MTCFICVQPLEQPTPISSHNLSELLTTTCKLLEIRDILEDEWKLLETPSVTLCCSSCAESLQRIKQLHDLLQRLQGRLKESLHNLKATVMSSSDKMNHVDVSQWNQAFFKFRSYLSVHRNQTPESMTDFYYDEDPLSVDDYSCDPLKVEPSLEVQTLYNSELTTESPFIESKPKEIVNSFENQSDYIDEDSLTVGSGSDIANTRRAPRKRKIVVIAEEDEPVSRRRGRMEISTLSESNSTIEDDLQPSGVVSTGTDSDGRNLLNKHLKTFHPGSYEPKRQSSHRSIPATTVTCDMCGEHVPKSGILQHVRDHVGDYAIKCPNPSCVHAFCTAKYYKLHMIYSRNKKATTDQCISFMGDGPKLDDCEICGYHDAVRHGLKKHMEITHESGTSKPFSCPVNGCSEAFSHRQTVTCHIAFRHSRPRDFKFTEVSNGQICPECFKPFPRDEIVSHFKDFHNTPMEQIVSCQYCPYKSLTKEQLVDHFVVHFRADIAVACDICTEEPIPRFSRLGTLRRHYLEVHQIGKSFICEHCSKPFTKGYLLDHHIRCVHSATTESQRCKPKTLGRTFTCDVCVEEPPKKYDQAGLVQHKILVHGAEPYKCHSCPETFTSWRVLISHKKEHKKVTRRSYTCDLPGCGFTTRTAGLLAQHKASILHRGRTNAFVCEDCGAGFNTEIARSNHRKQHAKVKEFVCDVCGRGFVSAHVLRTHVRLHSGELPFECSICKNRFNERGNFNRHMKVKHPKPT